MQAHRCGGGGIRRGVGGVAANAAAVLPALLVLNVEIWACLLAGRRAQRASRGWVRYSGDALAVAALAVDLLIVLFHRDWLTWGPVLGVVLPAGVWFSLLTWRRLATSRRLPLRAAADIVLSILLGTDLVLFSAA